MLANLINNLPAVLVLLPLAAPSGAGAVLAVLLGVNIGPNLTYTGSLATLLWRRVLQPARVGPVAAGIHQAGAAHRARRAGPRRARPVGARCTHSEADHLTEAMPPVRSSSG